MLELFANIFQRRPAWIFKRLGATALFEIEVATAMDAQSAAILAADRLEGQRQQDLFPQYLLEQESAALVISHFGLGCRNRQFLSTGVSPLRPVQEIELLGHMPGDRLKAAATSQLNLDRKSPGDSYVVD